MTTSATEPMVTAAERAKLRARHCEMPGWGDRRNNMCNACGGTPYPCVTIRALDALEQAWRAQAQLVAALRAAPRLQLALWYATYGPEVSPEPGRPDYELYKALRSVIAAVDARETKGADHA